MHRATEATPSRAASGWRERIPVRLVLFGAVAVVAVAFGFLAHNVNEARLLVQRYGYYTMAVTFVWAIVAVVKVTPAWVGSFAQTTRREAVTVAAIVMGLVLIALLTIPYTYKVLYDEFVLQVTAWCLHEGREVGAMVRGYEVEGIFSTLQTYLDKRPFFYTFLISVIHDLTGYREANAFVLNTALMPVALGLVYLLARRLADHLGALAALVGFGALSLLAQNATGAGMEMLNLVMLLVAMHLALWYLDAPDEPRLAALVLCTVLLAQTRYESSLYVAPAALVVLEGWRRAGRLILPAAAVLAPALLIPYALHNTYLSGTPMLWELRADEASRFSLVYLPDNLLHACQFFFSFTGALTNSWWLGIAGLPAALWALTAAVRRLFNWRRAPTSGVVMFLFGGAIAANLGLLMFYYWGQLDDPIVSRLSLPFSILLALCLAWAVMKFPPRFVRTAALVAITGAALSYATSGLVANATYWELNVQAREIDWEVKTVQKINREAPGNRLIITNKSSLIWLVHQISSVQIGHARLRAEEIKFHLDQHTFREALVMQTYRPIGPRGGFQLDPLDRLPDSFVLEPMLERRFGTHLLRISRVERIVPAIKPIGVQGSGDSDGQLPHAQGQSADQ